MRLASLGSGSGGNATLVEGAGTRVLIDCGFGPRVTRRRLHALGVDPETIDAVVVTHEHGDHVGGAADFAARYNTPLHATAGTLREWPDRPGGAVAFAANAPFRIGDLALEPFPVVHDAAEPCQLVVRCGPRSLAVVTDTGVVTPHIRAMVAGCDGILLECNHDPAMLRAGPYPPWVQDRIAGRNGHLANGQAAELLAEVDGARLQWVLAGHVSRSNNSPELVLDALQAPLARHECTVDLLAQTGDGRWHELR